MEIKKFFLEKIPALLIGKSSKKVYFFLHGMCGKKEEAIAFAKVVNPKGYMVLSVDMVGHGERENGEPTPFNVLPELQVVEEYLIKNFEEINVRGNSIGAYFLMHSFVCNVKNALFVSPIIDMFGMINYMMNANDISLEELKEKQSITLDNGQTLSYQYYCFAKEYPTIWKQKGHVLYGDGDVMTNLKTVSNFTKENGLSLTVMEHGEHWFHTDSELAFLEKWEDEKTKGN